MAAKFRAQHGSEGEAALGMGHNRNTIAPLVHNAWIISGSSLERSRIAVSRSSLPFTMKGGYVGTGRGRRLVIVGKIGKF